MVHVEYKKDRAAVLAELETLQKDASAILNLIQDPEVSPQLTGDKMSNIQYLQANHGFSESMLAPLYQLAMFNYQIGSYSTCAEMLYHVRLLVSYFIDYTLVWI